MPKRWHLCALAALAFLSVAHAETYYVAPDGSADNDGSYEKPWPSVEFALGQVGGGNTIVLKPGEYRGPIHIAAAHAGTETRPTVIKSEVKWEAVVIGAPYHCIANDDDCGWVVIDGFQVLGARYDGIKMNGDHNVVRNCWSHNNGHMGIAMHNKKGGVIENSLVEFNGSHVQFHHGIYADGDGLTIRGNIVRHNASFGLHLYPAVTNSVVAQNLVYGHPHKPGIILSCPEGGGKNTVASNTVVSSGACIEIWNGDGEAVANNILVSNGDVFAFDEATRNALVDYNLCVPPSGRQGPHGVTGDPLFVDPGHGVYWLQPGSPAIAAGSPEYAQETDFWGRPLPPHGPPDLGAFAFVPSLATAETREGWYYGWAYQYAPSPERGMPDLWATPRE